MNTIDIVCLVLMTILLLIGLWHGLLRGIFRLLAWIAAITDAYFINKFFSDTVAGFGFSDFSASIICICIGFLVPFLALLFTGHMVNHYVSDTVVGKVDRILGAFFGLVKGALVMFVILTILHVMPFGGFVQETRDNSVSYAAYKTVLATMGYSTEPVDLVGAAERKASEITEKMANKASEKVEEVAKETVEKATDAAKEAAKEAAAKAVKEASEKIAPTSEK